MDRDAKVVGRCDHVRGRLAPCDHRDAWRIDAVRGARWKVILIRGRWAGRRGLEMGRPTNRVYSLGDRLHAIVAKVGVEGSNPFAGCRISQIHECLIGSRELLICFQGGPSTPTGSVMEAIDGKSPDTLA